jgi:RNA polymerase sigma-70 factor (ECF subfamily)
VARLDRMPDADLAERARDGDGAAVEALLRRHQERVGRICLGLCRDSADAEDAAQEALMSIANGLARFDGRSSFATWAYRIAANRSLDELRRRRRRPEPVDPHGVVERPAPPGGDGRDPADVATAGVDRTRLLDALATLPDEFRDAVVLRDVLDLEYAEIAHALEVPVGTVRSRIARGRARLADALGNQDGPADVGDVGTDRALDRPAGAATPPDPTTTR